LGLQIFFQRLGAVQMALDRRLLLSSSAITVMEEWRGGMTSSAYMHGSGLRLLSCGVTQLGTRDGDNRLALASYGW
jgi:hypothetical protein